MMAPLIVPNSIFAAGSIELVITPSVSTANVGSDVTFTISMGSATGTNLRAIEFYLAIPNGVTFKYGSGVLSDDFLGMMTMMHDFDETPKLKISGMRQEAYNGAGLDIATFICTMTEAGTKTITLEDIELTDTSYGTISTNIPVGTVAVSVPSVYYEVTALADEGGSVAGSGIYLKNSEVSLEATPLTGYTFDGWYENDLRIDGAGTNYTFLVNSDRILEARFNREVNQGFKVEGVIKSYNPKNPTTIKLFNNDNQYTTKIEEEPGNGQTPQNFKFTGVVPGTYILEITKLTHTKFTVNNIIVDNKDLDLTQDSRSAVKVMTLLYGDINNDGFINVNDYNIVMSSRNYNKEISQVENKICDLNGDGFVNVNDMNIIWSSVNYNKGEVIIGPGTQ
jgi:hypothetical protein